MLYHHEYDVKLIKLELSYVMNVRKALNEFGKWRKRKGRRDGNWFYMSNIIIWQLGCSITHPFEH